MKIDPIQPVAHEMPIVFYDGDCGLCSRFVRVLLRHNKRKTLHFASLHGQTATSLLPKQPHDKDQWTMLFLDEKGLHERSTAALKILVRMGGVWTLAGIFFVVPRPIRDLVYSWIARHRYKWFGTSASCPIPSKEMASRFLP